jgi:predicted NAD/FAD-dependent oxidoreductase
MSLKAVDIAIIGAGTAGCFLAQLVQASGLSCILLEKSRGFGGRCSRRRIGNEYGVDLGAHGFNPNELTQPNVRAKVDDWINAGVLFNWQQHRLTFDKVSSDMGCDMRHDMGGDTASSSVPDDQREPVRHDWVSAAPAMNSWHKYLAHSVPNKMGSRVASLKRVENLWALSDEQDQVLALADKVVVTTPAEQAFDLLSKFDSFEGIETAAQQSLAQYVSVLGFKHSLNLPATVYQGDHGLMASAVLEQAKPGRIQHPEFAEVWLVHSTSGAAIESFAGNKEQAAQALQTAFCQQFKISQTPEILSSHYWRLAGHQRQTFSHNYLWDSAEKIGCCGDWLDNGTISGALNSSYALFEQLTT